MARQQSPAPAAPSLLPGLQHAATWWFPLVVAALSFVNTFVLVLSGPLVLLFCTAAIAQKQRFVYVALSNAVGVAAGISVFALLLQEHGNDWARASFPSVFNSETWQRTEGLVQSYGTAGIFLIACMPVALQPVVIVGVLGGIQMPVLLAIIFCGRCVKYLTMAWCAGNALDMLRFFGVPVHKLQAASATPDKSNKGKGQRQGQDARPKWLFALVGPWLLLSPANIIKIALINKPSPAAMYIVGEGMDKCQAECDIARMWGCLFWALQFCIASGIILTQPHWKQAPVTRVPYVMAKSAVGVGLLAAHFHGTLKLPPALVGIIEIVTAVTIFVSSAPPPQAKKKL